MSTCTYCGKGQNAEGFFSCAQCGVNFENFSEKKHPYSGGVEIPVKQKGGFLGKAKWDLDSLNPIQKWFAISQDLQLAKAIRDSFLPLEPAGVFNVEGGDAVVSTKQIQDCCERPAFWVEDTCGTCGTGVGNTVVMQAGAGDGIYPVWINDIEPARQVLVSFWTLPQNEADLENVWPSFDNAVPFYLGQIKSDGALYLRDSVSNLGQVSLILDYEVYDAVVWIESRISGPSMDEMMNWFSEHGDEDSAAGMAAMMKETLSPVAFTLTRTEDSDIKAKTQEVLDQLGIIPTEIAAALWGDSSKMISSHMESADNYVSLMSAQFFTQENDRQTEKGIGNALYHALKVDVEGLSEGLLSYIHSDDPNVLYFGACMLMSTGHVEEAISQMRKAADAGHLLANIFHKRMTACVSRRGDIYPIWGSMTSSHQMYRALLASQENIEDAMDYWTLAADRGTSNAVSYYTWEMLRRADFQGAIDFYDAVKEVCTEIFSNNIAGIQQEVFDVEELQKVYINIQQYVNAASNAALAMYAAGQPEENFMHLWAFGKMTDNAESLFFPALVAKRNGREDEFNSIMSELSQDTREELVRIFNEILAEFETGSWMHAMATESLNLIKS